MIIRPASDDDIPAITEIYNDAILTTTATFDLEPVTEGNRREWFDRHGRQYPILVAVAESGEIMGWGSLSPFAEKPAYQFAAEHSIYVDARYRQRGVGSTMLKELLHLAENNGFHCLVGRITGENLVSLEMHARSGFCRVGVLSEVGYKFGRWLDVVLMQKML